MDWESHKKHRIQVADDLGQWLGLLDENGTPICDLPQPITMQAVKQRSGIANLQLLLDLGNERLGGAHPAIRALIDDTVGLTDAAGRITPTPHTRIVVIQRRGTARRMCFEVAQRKSKAPSGGHHVMEIAGADMLTKLQRFPLMSMPKAWASMKKGYGWAETFTAWESFGITIPLDEKRRVKRVTLATAATGGLTIGGEEPGEITMWKALDQSLSAGFKALGVRQSIVAVKPASRVVAPMLIRPTDADIWQELHSRAGAAGINVTSDWWFPGDPQPELSPNHPELTDSTLLIRLETAQ